MGQIMAKAEFDSGRPVGVKFRGKSMHGRAQNDPILICKKAGCLHVAYTLQDPGSLYCYSWLQLFMCECLHLLYRPDLTKFERNNFTNI